METIYAKLREMVETHVGQPMQTPRDFNYLALRIWETQHALISSTTLKRFWGYLPSETSTNPRPYTLDQLAKFVGYRNWNSFVENAGTGNTKVDSYFIDNKIVYTRTLAEGTTIKLSWAPNRIVTIVLKGQDLFAVTESKNSKLSVGDTFICPSFVQGEALFLHCLVHEGGRPTDYVCGKVNGVQIEIVR